MRPKTFLGFDKRRNKYFGRFYRENQQCLKKDLIDFDELEFKETKRGRIRRSESERNQILHSLYSEKEKEIQLQEQRKSEEKVETLSRLAEDYLQQVQTLRSKQTFTTYRRSLQEFLSFFGKLEPEQLERKHLTIFVKSLQDRNLAKQSVNRKMINIGVFLNWIRTLGLLKKNLPIPQLRFTRKNPTTFSVEDLDRIEKHLVDELNGSNLNGQNRSAYINMYRAHLMLRYTGMRASELVHLRWIQIDPDLRFIMIKDNEKKEVKGRRERKIPIAEPLKRFLQGQPRTMYFLQRQNSDVPQWSHYQSMGRSFRRMYQLIGGLPNVKQLHGYRHTFATSLLTDMSTNPIHVQKLLGHKRIETTLLYLDSDQVELKETVDKLG